MGLSAWHMLSLPNLLTLSRIFAVPILVFLLWKPAPWDYGITFVLYCIVGITDYFDGYLARAQGQISKLGQFLDPIADKIMVAAVIIMLCASRKADGDAPIIQDFNIIPALIILLREIIVSGLREFLAELKVSMPVSRLAKWKTTFQLVSLGALILGGATPAQPWVHAVGVVSLWTGPPSPWSPATIICVPACATWIKCLTLTLIDFPIITDELSSFPATPRTA